MKRSLLLLCWLVPLSLGACATPVEDCSTPGDEDADGYADCADEVCWVPGGGCKEVCDSPFDEDADGVYGCFDDECWVAGGGCKEVCESGFDEDGDGDIDCADSDCWVANGFCTEACETDFDEDADSFPGCLDDECWYVGGPCEERCEGGQDEDADGDADCDDSDCIDDEACIPTFTADIQPIFEQRCAKMGCHVGEPPAGQWTVQSYDSMLLPAYFPACAGMTKGECTIVRILDTALPMPPDGTIVLPDEIDAIQRWVNGGIPE